MKTAIRTLLVAAALLLAGCQASMPKAPAGILEQIEAAELTAQQMGASIVSLTCTKFVAQKCVEPGKAFNPDAAIKHHETVQKVRAAFKTALGIGAGGIGQCLGEKRNQQACFNAAKLLLTELERTVLQAQGGK